MKEIKLFNETKINKGQAQALVTSVLLLDRALECHNKKENQFDLNLEDFNERANTIVELLQDKEAMESITLSLIKGVIDSKMENNN